MDTSSEQLMDYPEVAGLTAKAGKISGICDFSDSSPSTFFFRVTSDPSDYGWYEMTSDMRSTVISSMENSYTSVMYFDSNNKFNRLISYSK